MIDENEVLAEGYKALSGKAYHASDCATSNAPAYKPGPCDCDGPPLWRPFEDRPRDATVLVTVVAGPAHSYPDKIKPTVFPAYIDEQGGICDCSTWVPDKGLHGTHFRTIAWRPLPEPPLAVTETGTAKTPQSGLVRKDEGANSSTPTPETPHA